MTAQDTIKLLKEAGFEHFSTNNVCGYDYEEFWFRHPSGEMFGVLHFKYPPDAYREFNPSCQSEYRHNDRVHETIKRATAGSVYFKP